MKEYNHEGPHIDDSIYMQFPEQANPYKKNPLVAAQGWRNMVVTGNGYKPLNCMISELQLNKAVTKNENTNLTDGKRFIT